MITVLTSVDKGIDVLYFPDRGMVTVRDQGLHGVQQTVHIDDGPGEMTWWHDPPCSGRSWALTCCPGSSPPASAASPSDPCPRGWIVYSFLVTVSLSHNILQFLEEKSRSHIFDINFTSLQKELDIKLSMYICISWIERLNNCSNVVTMEQCNLTSVCMTNVHIIWTLAESQNFNWILFTSWVHI